jgi:hypothetical protein
MVGTRKWSRSDAELSIGARRLACLSLSDETVSDGYIAYTYENNGSTASGAAQKIVSRDL